EGGAALVLRDGMRRDAARRLAAGHSGGARRGVLSRVRGAAPAQQPAGLHLCRMRHAHARRSTRKGAGIGGPGGGIMSREPRLVEVRKNVLKQNDVVARELRQRFREAGVCVVSLVSSPGAGKTTLL